MFENIGLSYKSIAIYIIITIFVGLVVAVLGGFVLGKLQEKKIELTYYSPKTIPFKGDNQNIAIYTVQIINSGTSSVDDVSAVISFDKPVLKDTMININPTIQYQPFKTNNSYQLLINSLNPGDAILVSVYATSLDELPSSPNVFLRGKDVSGKPVESLGINDLIFSAVPILFILIIIGTIVSFLIGYIFVGPKTKDDISEFFPGLDNRDILSYLCNNQNLMEDTNYYTNLNRRISFWYESDRFYLLSRISTNTEEIEKRKKVLIDLLKFVPENIMYPSSRAIIHYNIARIAKIQKSNIEFEEHLAEAKKIDSTMIKKRQEIDPEI